MSGSGDRPPDGLSRGALLALGIGVALVRWVFAANRRIFHLTPDEPANLAIARWISGRTPWNMYDLGTWRPGLGVLIAPLHWLTDDPAAILRMTLVLNAALGGLGAVILALLARRLSSLSAAGSLAAAAAIAVTPSSLVASAHVWAEPLVTVSVLCATWHLLDFAREPSARPAMLATTWSVVGFTSHSRLLPLVATTIVLTFGVLTVRGRRVAAAGLVAASAALLAASILLHGASVDAVWDEPDRTNTVGDVARRLDDPLGIVESTVGQLWYQMAATLGLFGLGVVVLVLRAVGRGTANRVREARVLLATTIPLFALSALFMASRPRIDHAIYGRYNDAVFWLVLVVAIDALAGFLRNREPAGIRLTSTVVGSLVVTTLALGAVVELLHRDRFRSGVLVQEMVPGILFVTGDTSRVRPLVVSAVAAGALVLVALSALSQDRHRRLSLVLVGALLLLAGTRTRLIFDTRVNRYEGADYVAELDGTLIPERAGVGLRIDPSSPDISLPDQRLFAQLYQWYLPDHRFDEDRGLDDDVGPLVFAPVNDPVLVSGGAERLWLDPLVGLALWHEPDG